MLRFLVATFILCSFQTILGDRCGHPPAAENFKNSLYEGRWYEIGKVRKTRLKKFSPRPRGKSVIGKIF